MNHPTIAKMLGLTMLSLTLWAGTPLVAQQQKPTNPQLPDPNSKAEQQPSAATPSGSQTPGQTSQSSSQASTEANGQGQISSQTQQIFIGRIVESKDQFVLKDSKSNTTYQLDRQDIAKQYGGKEVRVTGTLDTTDNIIRISTIEPLSN